MSPDNAGAPITLLLSRILGEEGEGKGRLLRAAVLEGAGW